MSCFSTDLNAEGTLGSAIRSPIRLYHKPACSMSISVCNIVAMSRADPPQEGLFVFSYSRRRRSRYDPIVFQLDLFPQPFV